MGHFQQCKDVCKVNEEEGYQWVYDLRDWADSKRYYQIKIATKTEKLTRDI